VRRASWPRAAVSSPPRFSSAREAGVPVHKDPELADALAGLALGQEVPEALWTAVAEALAWAYSVSDAAITPNR
jgi:flagellar biosynthesis protein